MSIHEECGEEVTASTTQVPRTPETLVPDSQALEASLGIAQDNCLRASWSLLKMSDLHATINVAKFASSAPTFSQRREPTHMQLLRLSLPGFESLVTHVVTAGADRDHSSH